MASSVVPAAPSPSQNLLGSLYLIWAAGELMSCWNNAWQAYALQGCPLEPLGLV